MLAARVHCSTSIDDLPPQLATEKAVNHRKAGLGGLVEGGEVCLRQPELDCTVVSCNWLARLTPIRILSTAGRERAQARATVAGG